MRVWFGASVIVIGLLVLGLHWGYTEGVGAWIGDRHPGAGGPNLLAPLVIAVLAFLQIFLGIVAVVLGSSSTGDRVRDRMQQDGRA